MTPGEWLRDLFEYESCAECGGDADDHGAVLFAGNWLARCKRAGGSQPHDSRACSFGVDAQECALARERSVAGVSNTIPACPVHGPYTEVADGSDRD